MRLLLVLVLAGCGGDEGGADGVAWAQEYLPPVDSWLQYGLAGNPIAPPWLIVRAETGTWELREGEEWSTAERLDTLPVDTSAGLEVGGTLLLPEKLEVGASADGVEVLALEEVEVYYGTFPDAVRVRVEGGRFGGEHAFALGRGPVALTLEGEAWELVWYE